MKKQRGNAYLGDILSFLQQRFQFLLQHEFGNGSDLPSDLLAVLEENHRRYVPDGIPYGYVVVLFHVTRSDNRLFLVGANALHGPHHSAPKSTMSGFSIESSSSKFFSVACIIIIRYRLYSKGCKDTEISPDRKHKTAPFQKEAVPCKRMKAKWYPHLQSEYQRD